MLVNRLGRIPQRLDMFNLPMIDPQTALIFGHGWNIYYFTYVVYFALLEGLMEIFPLKRMQSRIWVLFILDSWVLD